MSPWEIARTRPRVLIDLSFLRGRGGHPRTPHTSPSAVFPKPELRVNTSGQVRKASNAALTTKFWQRPRFELLAQATRSRAPCLTSRICSDKLCRHPVSVPTPAKRSIIRCACRDYAHLDRGLELRQERVTRMGRNRRRPTNGSAKLSHWYRRRWHIYRRRPSG